MIGLTVDFRRIFANFDSYTRQPIDRENQLAESTLYLNSLTLSVCGVVVQGAVLVARHCAGEKELQKTARPVAGRRCTKLPKVQAFRIREMRTFSTPNLAAQDMRCLKTMQQSVS